MQRHMVARDLLSLCPDMEAVHAFKSHDRQLPPREGGWAQKHTQMGKQYAKLVVKEGRTEMAVARRKKTEYTKWCTGKFLSITWEMGTSVEKMH